MKCCGTCNDEPGRSDLLGDPIVALLMARDGVTRGDVENLLRLIANSAGTSRKPAGCLYLQTFRKYDARSYGWPLDFLTVGLEGLM